MILLAYIRLHSEQFSRPPPSSLVSNIRQQVLSIPRPYIDHLLKGQEHHLGLGQDCQGQS